MSDPVGPVVVVGRPRSGTRVVAALLRDAGYFMGADVGVPRLDSLSWFQRLVVPLVTTQFFPDWPASPELKRFWRDRLADTWPRYLGTGPLPDHWGWKYPETLFVLPLLQQEFPRMRVVHLIRDGRDVCVSRGGFFQATGPLGDPPGWGPPAVPGSVARTGAGGVPPRYREFCFAVTFGSADVTRWRGIDLTDPVARVQHRFLIGLQAWAFAIETAREFGVALGERYREVRYEDLCAEPTATAQALLTWLGGPGARSTASPAAVPLSSDRVGAWRRQPMTASESRDFEAGLAHAADLLAALGYR